MRFLLIGLFLILAGCSIHYGDTPYSITNCTSSVRVETSHRIAGGNVYLRDVYRSYSLTGWKNGVCTPEVRDMALGNKSSATVPGCRYKQADLDKGGVNGALIAMLNNCGVKKTDEVLIDGIAFPQYEANSS